MTANWTKVRTIAFGVLAGVVASAGTLAVTVAGFALSYDALRAVGVASRIREELAWLLPVSVDGAMGVGTIAAVVLRRMTGKTAVYPWAVVLVGAGISIACNGLHAIPAPGVHLVIEDPEVRFAVSAIPAVMLALSVHLLVTLVEAASEVGVSSGRVTGRDGAIGVRSDHVTGTVDGRPDDAQTKPSASVPATAADAEEPADPALDPWAYAVPSVRPSASSSAAAGDRPRRVPMVELDRVWANLSPARLSGPGQSPSEPSAEPSAHVDTVPGAGKPDTEPEPVDDADDLLDGARTVAADLARQGVSLSRDNLAKAMREAGLTVSNDRASGLVRALRTADGRPDDARTVNGKKPTFIDR